MQLPKVCIAEQKFNRPRAASIEEAIAAQLKGGSLPADRLKGKRIAVTAGSRGIDNYQQIMRCVVDIVKSMGADVFIVPAMGSHGGGTAEGQEKILADYGITKEGVGAPVLSSMETVDLGFTTGGIPVHLDRNAYESDGVIVVNRVKPHTDFQGEIESGLSKMSAVGLGKRHGAKNCHNLSSEIPMDEIIKQVATVTLATGKIIGGLAILENAYHETARFEYVSADRFLRREPELLLEAKSLMPSLPVERGDVLIIDHLGKNISGVGMDPNVTGRRYRINIRYQDKPDFTRIVLLDLTEETKGNAAGIGLADICNKRAIDKIDRKSSYLNAMTSRNLITAQLPLDFESDRDALECAIQTAGGNEPPESSRLLRIRDTLSLSRLVVSESLADELRGHPQVVNLSEPHELAFDRDGNLPADIWEN